jgi:peptide/nickel transport system permease protein
MNLALRLPRISNGGLIGSVILSVVIVLAIATPWLPIGSPTVPSLVHRLMPPDLATATQILGTDQLGRDMFARILHGSRITLLVCLATLVVGGVFGIGVGLIAGYFGGWVDRILMRVLDMQLSIPTMLLALLVVAALGPDLVNLVLVMALATWTQYARVVRGQVLSVRELDFVRSAQSIGAGHLRIMLRHILPNTLSTIIVIATLELARLILMEASLSFLGLGVPPPYPSWGRMLAEGRPYMADAWWITAVPGLAIAVTVLGVNLLGDWLRDRFDPKMGSQK